MTYYVGNMPVGEHLAHYGTKGMKWGQRRYQNPDGSLTAAGQARYHRYQLKSVDPAIAKNRQTRRVAEDYHQLSGRAFRDKYYASKGTFKRRYRKSDGDTYSMGRRREKRAKEFLGKARAASSWVNNNKKKLAGAALGTAAVAGAAHLGYRNRGQLKGLARSAGNAFKNFNGARNEFAGVRKPGSRTAKVINGKYQQVFKNGMSKIKRDPNVKVLRTELSTKTRRQSKEAFKKFAGKAGKVGKTAGKVGKAALKFGGNNHVIGAATNAAMGSLYYAHARKGGASKKQAMAVGVTRAATGRILPAHAVGIGVKAYNNRKKKKSRK